MMLYACSTTLATTVRCTHTLAHSLSFSSLFSLPLQTSGIIVLVMLFSSCLCCCSVCSLCCGDFPKAIKIFGVVLFILVCLALSVYIGWIALGTYFAIEIRSASSVCRNVIVYLCLLYIYLIVLALVGIVLVVWKCHDLRTKSNTPASHRVSKSGRGSR